MSNEILKKIANEMDMPEDAAPEHTLEAVEQLREQFLQTSVRELQVRNELISIQNLISEHRYHRGFSAGLEELRILAAIEEKILKLCP